MAKDIFLGVDLGGTNLSAAAVDLKKGKVIGEAKRKTDVEGGAPAICRQIATLAAEAAKDAGLKRKEIAGLGVGVPGPIHARSGVVVNCANLGPTWNGFPLRQTLSELIEMPVTVDNDVNVGAVGEHTFGAGRGTQDMLAIFVGTGIGGGIILGGKLRSGFRDSAGEVGHVVILADGPLCSCGQRGHAEALASRTAIDRGIREALDAGRPSIVPQLMEQSHHTVLSSSIIGDAYDQHDKVVVEVIERAQYYLGILISVCVNILDPEVVVVGGGVLERLGDCYLERVRPIAREHYINKTDTDKVRILRAALGDYSGVMGAAMLAKQRLQ